MNTSAFEEGYKAYENYQHLSDNPHPLNDLELFSCKEHWDWEYGYFEARRDGTQWYK
jgi:hypothetical protein